MEYEESIYNLIPQEKYNPPKEKRHKSGHDPKCAPTGTTFGLKTTSRPGVGNLSGSTNPAGGSHLHTANGATFGKPVGAVKPQTTDFRKKQTGTIKIPEPQKFERVAEKKPAIPKKEDKPIMGLVSDKNFIVANAVENILAAPRLPENKNKDYLKKKNFGKVPQYLQKIKGEIDDEYRLVREMQIEEQNEMDRQKFLMNDEERKELISALKKKWEVVHKEYQTLTHKVKLDTIGLKDKYENCEKEMHQLEQDIQKLSKNYIFVDTMAPSSFF